MRAKSRTKVRDRGWARLRAELEKARGRPHVKVGVLAADADKAYEGGGTTVLDVAIWNEFGTERIPERSFLRSTADEQRAAMGSRMQAYMRAFENGSLSISGALERIGLEMQAAIKHTIVTMTDPPNAPSTIRAKARRAGRREIARARREGGKAAADAALAKYNNPLIDTGQLLNSIHSEVVLP